MSFNGSEIRILRQRLGWSMAEMARRMGCNTELIQIWESGKQMPDFEALNQLRHLRSQVDMSSEHLSQKPYIETEMERRQIGQLTHRDLLKDN